MFLISKYQKYLKEIHIKGILNCLHNQFLQLFILPT